MKKSNKNVTKREKKLLITRHFCLLLLEFKINLSFNLYLTKKLEKKQQINLLNRKMT